MGPKSDEPSEFLVEPENRDAVQLYQALETQWRVETASVVIGDRCIILTRQHGIDYSAVPIVAAGRGIALTPALWQALQVAEREALVIYAKREESILRRS